MCKFLHEFSPNINCWVLTDYVDHKRCEYHHPSPSTIRGHWLLVWFAFEGLLLHHTILVDGSVSVDLFVDCHGIVGWLVNLLRWTFAAKAYHYKRIFRKTIFFLHRKTQKRIWSSKIERKTFSRKRSAVTNTNEATSAEKLDYQSKCIRNFELKDYQRLSTRFSVLPFGRSQMFDAPSVIR